MKHLKDSLRFIEDFPIEGIKFIDISRILLKILALKEFKKYNGIYPKKIDDIEQLSKLVSLKVDTLSV